MAAANKNTEHSWVYRGCQKNVAVFKRFFLQPLMPHFRIPEHYYGKRYKICPVLEEWNGLHTCYLKSDFFKTALL